LAVNRAGRGAVIADFSARLAGRGGYLHPRRECLDQFTRAKGREFRSLKRKIEPVERRAIVAAIAARLES
jgi:predicted RNA-binding protein YlxR (DUF448 family)